MLKFSVTDGEITNSAFTANVVAMAKNAILMRRAAMLLGILGFFNTSTLMSQIAVERISGGMAIRKLHSGTLLVRLESHEKKIALLEKLAESADCDEKCRTRRKQEADEISAGRDRFNRAFMKAFSGHYHFSRVYFYYDRDHRALQSQGFGGRYFLDDSLRFMDAGPFSADSILLLVRDKTPGSAAEGWLLKQPDNQPLPPDFPYLTINNYKTLVNYFSDSDHVNKNCKYLVRKLNKTLVRYYSEAERRRQEATLLR